MNWSGTTPRPCVDTPVNEVYDPVTDSWSTLQPAPITQRDYASAVVDNKIYILGGPNGLNTTSITRSNMIYDVETDTWFFGELLPTETYFAAAGATTGVMAPKRIYVVGGGLTKPMDTVLVYDPTLDNWTFGAPIPTNRTYLAVAVVNDTLYAIGGCLSWQGGVWPYSGSASATDVVEAYTPFGYGIVPSIVSPETNKTYVESEVPLTFTLLKLASWLGYSLDGQDNVTFTGNTTLTGLANGFHNVTVYVKDPLQNEVASEIMYFTVETPFPAALVVAVSGASIAAVATGFFVLFKKRKHAKINKDEK